MNVQITQENLNKALAAISRVVGSRTTLPVLANVLLQTENNRLKLAGTNLEMGMTAWIGAKVETEGSITIPAKLLSEYISNLPSGNVTMRLEKTSLHLSADNFTSKINGIEADEFPSIPTVDGQASLEIPATNFVKSLSQVVQVAATDESRPVLAGVYFHTHDGVLYAVATDSYRLAQKQIQEVDGEYSFIVPARTISELLRVVDDTSSQPLAIKVDENQVSFEFNDIQLVSRLIDGQFPNYRQLIPETVPTTAIVATTELQNITKITGLFARENAGSLTVSVSSNALHMRSIASQVGENTSQVTAEVSGDDIDVSLNSRYISDALAVIGSEQVSFGLTGKVNPCILRPIDDESYLHIIMPLKS